MTGTSFNITDFTIALPWHLVPSEDGTLRKAEDVRIAWDFVRPAQEDGMIQAFLREKSPAAEVHLKPQEFSDGAHCEFTDLDTGGDIKANAKELMPDGLGPEGSGPAHGPDTH